MSGGWNVPQMKPEWMILFDYLGGLTVAGGKLKESGTTHWNNPNESATNIERIYSFAWRAGGGVMEISFILGILVSGGHITWDSLAKFFPIRLKQR
jgi:hypothetical protein